MRLSVTIGVALLALLGTVNAKPSSFGHCNKEDEGVTYGVPSDCHKYVICKKGSLEVQECSKKYNYDTVTAKCVKAKDAVCAVEPSPEEPAPEEPAPEEPAPEAPGQEETNEQYDYLCTKVLYGVRIHPEACDKYLVCQKEKATIEYCPEGFIFLAEAISCLPGNTVTCTMLSDEPSTSENPPSVSVESGEDESKESDEDDSSEDSKESSGKYDYLCGSKTFGTLTHPDSCTKYITCSKNKAKEHTCKKGYAYSSKLHLCVKQTSGGCADAPEDPPATTEAITEATTEATTETIVTKNPGSDEDDSSEDSKESSGKYDYLCGSNTFGTLTHPDSCTKYITCSKNKAKEHTCKKGYAYSSKLHVCVKQTSGGCADAPEPPTPTEGTTSYPGGENTNATQGTPEATEPPTEPATSADPIPPVTGGDPMEPENNCVEGFTGYLPIENDCTTYVYCFQGEPGQRSCLEEYIYYDPLKACLPGDPITCQIYSV